MNYRIGQILPVSRNEKIELLHYNGEFRKKCNGTRIFKVPSKQKTEDGREHAYYEMWECLNLNTGIVSIKKLPVFVYHEQSDDTVFKDRIDTIDDSNEVTSLLDHYSCWLEGFRDKKNFHLNIINDRHEEQISRLVELDSNETNSNYKTGIRLKLIQKQHPNSMTRNAFNTWKQEFPDLFTNLIKDVYKNNDSVDVADSSNM